MMNFKMKAVVTAIALTASMSASAAMSNNASGDSSLILTLLDNNNSVSAAFDLGYSYSSFSEALVAAPGTKIDWNLAGNANYSAAWNSFAGSANLANSHWMVFAGDSIGSAAGTKGMVISYTSLPATNQTTSELGTQLGNFDTYIGANNSLGNHGAVADGADFTTGSNANAYAGYAKAYNLDGKVGLKGPVTWGSFDQSLGIVQITNGSSALAKTSNNVYANQFGASSFKLSSNGQLSYVAAVPEADTWAMLLAGLGLMGFIARRRTAA